MEIKKDSELQELKDWVEEHKNELAKLGLEKTIEEFGKGVEGFENKFPYEWEEVLKNTDPKSSDEAQEYCNINFFLLYISSRYEYLKEVGDGKQRKDFNESKDRTEQEKQKKSDGTEVIAKLKYEPEEGSPEYKFIKETIYTLIDQAGIKEVINEKVKLWKTWKGGDFIKRKRIEKQFTEAGFFDLANQAILYLNHIDDIDQENIKKKIINRAVLLTLGPIKEEAKKENDGEKTEYINRIANYEDCDIDF